MTDSLMGRMGVEPILFVKLPITIDTMLNFGGDGDGVETRKHTFIQAIFCLNLVINRIVTAEICDFKAMIHILFLVKLLGNP